MAEHAPHLVDLATAERVDREFRPANKTLRRPADDVGFPPAMRAAIAQHRTLSAEALVGLLSDGSAWVAQAAGGSPHLPVSRMARLLSLADL